jgi:DNA-binding response OmpR family regulator
MGLQRILLVEKDEGERARRAVMLVAQGYRVATVSGPEDAGAAVGAAMPDLILVGLQRRPEAVSAIVKDLRSRFRQARIAVLMHESHRLCAVALDDVVVIPAERPRDFVRRVARALAPSTAAKAVGA